MADNYWPGHCFRGCNASPSNRHDMVFADEHVDKVLGTESIHNSHSVRAPFPSAPYMISDQVSVQSPSTRDWPIPLRP
jgi:hypothetical protein